MKLWLRRLHKWIGVIACVFMLLVSTTALALNHRELWLRPGMGTAANTAFSLSQARAWAADPVQAHHLLAADAHHLYQSRDAGASWQEVKLYVPAENISALAFSPQGRHWVALRDAGIFYSDDGEIWEELSTLPFDPVAGEAIESLSAGKHHLYVRTSLGEYSCDAACESWTSRSVSAKNEQLGLQDWVWRLHTGRGFGWAGLLLYDLISLALILLSVSGIALAFWPRRKARPRPAASPPEKAPVLEP